MLIMVLSELRLVIRKFSPRWRVSADNKGKALINLHNVLWYVDELILVC